MRGIFGKHFGLPWKDAFQVDEPSAVERYCVENGVEFEWVDRPGGALRTRQYRPVVARHPLTGELVLVQSSGVLSHIQPRAGSL